LEVNVRGDGSSRFEKDQRWGIFPSVSAGWVISNEGFFAGQNLIDLLKIRGSYGALGNQNVANYLYVPTLPVKETDQWLFSGARAWTVGSPNLTSVDLTWEQVATVDLGLDVLMLENRLGFTFGVYESHTTSLVGPGEPLPAVLGTAVPKRNEGEIRTRGWELEASWKHRVNDFSYELRAVVSDYQSVVVSYNNPTNLLSSYYDGQNLGEIWGLESPGWFQSTSDIEDWGIDQSYIYSGDWFPGDAKYIDQNGDDRIDIGDNTYDDHGDLVVLGNQSPRYVYGLNASFRWKGIDVFILLQGIAKRDLYFTDGSFRGPAAGPMHNNVLKGHLDYWRDDTSVLGANPDAYFPRPYAQYWAQNGKNFSYPTDHLLQSGAFLRLKNLQIGYTLPSSITRKIHMSNARIYVSGENLLTFTKLMFYDPEAFRGRWYGAGDAYPLSKTLSVGLSVNF
jgi:TonB-linked SusC/RagA family outer membrane protein